MKYTVIQDITVHYGLYIHIFTFVKLLCTFIINQLYLVLTNSDYSFVILAMFCCACASKEDVTRICMHMSVHAQHFSNVYSLISQLELGELIYTPTTPPSSSSSPPPLAHHTSNRLSPSSLRPLNELPIDRRPAEE